jgi:ABC-type multidrug transport system ATPase subunit
MLVLRQRPRNHEPPRGVSTERTNSPPRHGVVVISTTGLSARFGGVIAVNRLSMEVREGEGFGLLGPNGAGKSTTVPMNAGLIGITEVNTSCHWTGMGSAGRRTAAEGACARPEAPRLHPGVACRDRSG